MHSQGTKPARTGEARAVPIAPQHYLLARGQGRLLLIVATVFWLAGCSPSTQAPPAVPAPATAAPSTPIALREGKIALTVASEYPLSSTRQVYETLSRASRDRDDAPVKAALLQGRAFLVPNGTRVKILRTDLNLIQVEVTNGTNAGRSGWLPVNLVGP